MFWETLVTLDQTWKQLKSPLEKEDVVYLHDGILFSHKKNEIVPFLAAWMDLEMIILSDASQISYDVTYK